MWTKVGGMLYPLELLQNARMQILVHLSVLEGIARGFLGRGYGGVEVLEHACEAYADVERVGHIG